MKEIKFREGPGTSRALDTSEYYLLCSSLSPWVGWVGSFTNILIVLFLKLQAGNPQPFTGVQPWLTLLPGIWSQFWDRNLRGSAWVLYDPWPISRGWAGVGGPGVLRLCPQTANGEGPLERKCVAMITADVSCIKSNHRAIKSTLPWVDIVYAHPLPFPRVESNTGIYCMFSTLYCSSDLFPVPSFINCTWLCQARVTS